MEFSRVLQKDITEDFPPKREPRKALAVQNFPGFCFVYSRFIPTRQSKTGSKQYRLEDLAFCLSI